MSNEVHAMPNGVSPGKLWFGLLAAPVAWAVHDTFAPTVTGIACRSGNPDMGVRLVLVLFTVVAIVIGLWGGLTAWSSWRRLGANTKAEGPQHRFIFMAMAGMLVSSLALIGLLYGLIPTLLLNICEAVR